ncbi:PBSX family phage terminase large subunit [Priestia megaterium]|uniref:PBSX family phage terminase large subunit n=1 Tax=Priestia megaterium TaxID=1404 RepID=UPI001ABF32C7|nr:PBSX family phage terminase large subunit [Priestia megaterium]
MTVKEINPHFENFLFDWDHKFYFLVGGYGSSKSYHVALKLMLKLLQEKRTALVVREVYETIRESCFSLLQEIAIELGLEGKVKFITSPMSVRFPNGSKIIFRGVDKPEKLKSINNVSLVWLEECSEIKYDGFKELLGRLRHPTMKLHMLLSTNPVSTSNWCYKYFFQDKQNKRFTLDDEELYRERTIIHNDIYYHHSTADDNLFLPQDYIEQLEDLKTHDIDLYRIARRGRFGVNGKRVLPQFVVAPHEEVMQVVNRIPYSMKRTGMDFGFVTSYNAVIRMAIDHKNKYLYLYWEYYKNGMTDDKTAEELQELKRERIKADGAEPKTIRYFKQQGFRMEAAKKFPGSRLQYTKKVKRFKKIICSDQCINSIDELKDLTYKENKQGELIEDEFNIDSHILSAIWYGLDDYEVSDLKGIGVSSKNAFSR